MHAAVMKLMNAHFAPCPSVENCAFVCMLVLGGVSLNLSSKQIGMTICEMFRYYFGVSWPGLCIEHFHSVCQQELVGLNALAVQYEISLQFLMITSLCKIHQYLQLCISNSTSFLFMH